MPNQLIRSRNGGRTFELRVTHRALPKPVYRTFANDVEARQAGQSARVRRHDIQPSCTFDTNVLCARAGTRSHAPRPNDSHLWDDRRSVNGPTGLDRARPVGRTRNNNSKIKNEGDNMNTKLRGIAYLCLLFAGMVASLQARAEYRYTLVDYPGAVSTLFWGINNAGLIVGQASLVDPVDGPFFDFTYDPGKGVFTPVPDVPGAVATGAIGLNEKGTVVGSASFDPGGEDSSAFILDKKGEHTVFKQPGWDDTRARAIGSSGKVTGYSSAADFSDFTGFIYNPKDGRFIDIDFPNSSTVIPQGINGRGDVVGSVVFFRDGAFPGSPPGTYAFLRGQERQHRAVPHQCVLDPRPRHQRRRYDRGARL